jgi:DNA polymerase III delta subunit
MLHILEGNDFDLKKKALEKIRASADFGVVSYYELWEESLVEYVDSVDLFSELRLIIIEDAVFEDVAPYSKALQQSHNHFVLLFKPLTAIQKKSFAGASVVSCIPPKKVDEKFNTFSLTDALVARDKKNLWILYQKARRAGVTEHEIVPILIWQLKTMLLVAQTSVSESGLKPFVYNKTKKCLEKYTVPEIESLYKDFVSMYHNARRDTVLDIDLERAILSL